MLKNYLKISIKNLSRYKGYSLLNILGLAIGLAAFFMVLLFVKMETSYDRFHEKADRIFRITAEYIDDSGRSDHWATTDHQLAPLLEANFPEIEQTMRIEREPKRVVYGDKSFTENRICFVDANFFQFFSFHLLKGNPKTALAGANRAILSETTAQKYFDHEVPVGKTLTIEQRGESFDVVVTGVMQDFPENSHFHADILISQSTTARDYHERRATRWQTRVQRTYLLLPRNLDYRDLEARINHFMPTHLPDDLKGRYRFILQPLKDIHLHSHLSGEFEANGDINDIYIFGSIAFFILLVACINYMNLATARAQKRAREVGIRKSIGAQKSQLMIQFLTESLSLTLIACGVALVLVELALPVLNKLIDANLQTNYAANTEVLILFLFIAMITAIVSGGYPAFYLSAAQPATVLKGKFTPVGSVGFILRKGLVVLQFTISTVLIISALLILNQLDFLRNKKVGINTDRLVRIFLQTFESRRNIDVFKTSVRQNPQVQTMGMSDAWLTAEHYRKYAYRLDDGGEEHYVQTVQVDYDYFETLEADILRGRNFSPQMSTDTVDAFVINEAAANLFGTQSILGKRLESRNQSGEVIGVVEDFHFGTFHTPVQPTVFRLAPEGLPLIYIRVSDQDVPATVEFLKAIWKKYDPGVELWHSFIGDDLTSLYRSEDRMLKASLVFSALAIFISCIGILGLSAFAMEQRMKEIGIRKVFGASIKSIVSLLVKHMLGLVLVAGFISWPIAFFAMSKWMANFAYQVDIAVEPFVMATLLMLVSAILSVSFHSIKASITNPVDILRNE